MALPTDAEIEDAKKGFIYSLPEGHHEHPDCIRIAYQWLDAQKLRKTPSGKSWALKHIIEAWGGRYVSMTDVEIAGFLHPDINGRYPDFNLSARLIKPSQSRLNGLSEANTQNYNDDGYDHCYSLNE